MARYIFDCETNGFLRELDRIHCLVIKDVDTGEVFSYAGTGELSDGTSLMPVPVGMKRLMDATEIIGHNVIGFDIPALEKVYPWFKIDRAKVTDTIVMAKLYKGNVKEEDLSPRYMGTPRRGLFGQQSLKAWGIRLGDHKGDYQGGWEQWNEEMQRYCEQDVEVTFKLYQYLRKLGPWPIAEKLEHEAAWVCSAIERNGIRFNVDKAVKLYSELAQKRHVLANELKSLFHPWVVYQGEVVSKANNKKHGHTKGAVFSKIIINEFNPLSRDHIANRLTAKYGWKPDKFTDGGKPQVDETVLSGLQYPEAKKLAELFLLTKRIGQIAEGDEAWLKHEKDGWVYHRLNPNGAVTGRATHSKFNITQVPKVGSLYGAECREMFEVPEGWELFGADASGLELRCLGHFMAKWDGGAYGQAVVNGKESEGSDVHSLNCKALAMQPQALYSFGGKQQKGRNCSKTYIYALIYGAGDLKLGKIIGKGPKGGKKSRTDLMSGIPALGELIKAVKSAVKRGYLIGLDGRHMHIRSDHAALNTLLQGAGAAICKKWMVEMERLLLDAGYHHGWEDENGIPGDFAFCIWAHDEDQIARNVKTLPREVLLDVSKRAMKITEEFFKFKVPLDCEGKFGNNWKETH